MVDVNNGPIPGENFTSDTRNYPWHQPPQYTSIDDALDMMSDKMVKKDVANSLLTIVELGVPLYKVASMLVMSGVMNGKWTPDFALLLVGPITRVLELLCIGYGVDYNIGIEDEEEMLTGDFFKTLHSSDKTGDVEIISSGIEELKQDVSQEGNEEEKTEEPDLGSMGFMKEQTASGVNV